MGERRKDSPHDAGFHAGWALFRTFSARRGTPDVTQGAAQGCHISRLWRLGTVRTRPGFLLKCPNLKPRALPGRCPGLSHLAPLALNDPSGRLQPQRGCGRPRRGCRQRLNRFANSRRRPFAAPAAALLSRRLPKLRSPISGMTDIILAFEVAFK